MTKKIVASAATAAVLAIAAFAGSGVVAGADAGRRIDWHAKR